MRTFPFKKFEKETVHCNLCLAYREKNNVFPIMHDTLFIMILKTIPISSQFQYKEKGVNILRTRHVLIFNGSFFFASCCQLVLYFIQSTRVVVIRP
uniref:Uncharacterized protein n=1 Tax=Setaria italica TaxID=4555 RepID=K4ANF3_SETIT